MLPEGADRSAVEKNTEAAGIADPYRCSVGKVKILTVAFLKHAGEHRGAGGVASRDPSKLGRLQAYVLAGGCRAGCR